MRLRKRLPSDRAQVFRALMDAGLPPDGLDGTIGWVLEVEGSLVGHVAESTLDAVVIRSLVVLPAQRGKGAATRLMAEAEASAAGRAVVLKTETIGPWIERRGYRLATLDQVPSSVRTTTQFSGSLCASTPVYLRLPVQPDPVRETRGEGPHVYLKEKAMDEDTLKAAVRERYAGFVAKNTSCCGPATKGCGCSGAKEDPSLQAGYAIQDIEAVPDGANLGLGCGNPVALASLEPGEAVLDLGSGAGFDAFLASKRVGAEGHVIGVDMTPEMIARARYLAAKHGYANVEFRQGDIERLPIGDAAVDVVISNCVINLTTDKARAFREAFRVLKPGGRLMISDLVLLKPLPESVRRDVDAYAACIAGALQKEDYLETIRVAGFSSVEVMGESRYDLGEFSEAVVSVQVRALKAMP